jgi:hypothetical protein
MSHSPAADMPTHISEGSNGRERQSEQRVESAMGRETWRRTVDAFVLFCWKRPNPTTCRGKVCLNAVGNVGIYLNAKLFLHVRSILPLQLHLSKLGQRRD